MSAMTIDLSELFSNFPFPEKRKKYQTRVLSEICEAFNSDYKNIILEAPSGFGKSAVAITVAKTLGSSYICTSTKDLQYQYARDFPFLKTATGMNNFLCLVREDFIRSGTYVCDSCKTDSNNSNECQHRTVEYGKCKTEGELKNKGYKYKGVQGCRYRTFAEDYIIVSGRRTDEEQVSIIPYAKAQYQKYFSEWQRKEKREVWEPCGYYDQINIASAASHSSFNYSNFLAFLSLQKNSRILRSKEFLALDEGHLLETEVIKFRGLSISKKRWGRYIHNFEIPSSSDYGYDDIDKWLEFLNNLAR
jgi:ATP-dependent DNA helicase DinG